jgi:hypothetical protein
MNLYLLNCVSSLLTSSNVIIDVPGTLYTVNTVDVYNCNTYMQTRHHSKNGVWYAWYWIWLKNNVSGFIPEPHLYLQRKSTWSVNIFNIQATMWGISCLVISTIHVSRTCIHGTIKLLCSTQSISLINAIQTWSWYNNYDSWGSQTGMNISSEPNVLGSIHRSAVIL